MNSLCDRFRHWFGHEKDSNAKLLGMLESIPAERHSDPLYAKALEKTAHIAVARQVWFCRVGQSTVMPTNFFPKMTLDEIRTLFTQIEKDWTHYLASLTDADLAQPMEYTRMGNRMRYTIEGALTQTLGHAFYHRGQVGTLVAMLGGKFVDTDYVFWHKPEVLGPA
jgi:uncharacterized damage-inducible protein DinB